MITLTIFLNAVQHNARRVYAYQSGHDGSDGTCDCIGEIIGAVRLAGEKWPWTHGSNYAARYRMRTLHSVSSEADLSLGELVYKAREPGEAGYDLPSTYKDHPDQRDYYHMGVVTGVSPLEITHCTKSGGASGIFRDTKLGKWSFAGELNLVDYSDSEGSSESADDVYPVYIAIVTAPSGNTVRMRKSPSLKAQELAAVPIGTEVGVLGEYDDEWSRIEYNGKRGYMMAQFLKKTSPDPSETEDTVQISRQKLQEFKALGALLTPLLSYVENLLEGRNAE